MKKLKKELKKVKIKLDLGYIFLYIISKVKMKGY